MSSGGAPLDGGTNGDAGPLDGAPDAPVATLTVEPRYPTNGPFWLDYVKNDGADRLQATDTACEDTVDGPRYDACVHGGEIRRVALPAETSCTGVTATDALDAFDWVCQAASGGTGIEVVSTGLKDGKHLTDLLDFSTNDWRPNSVSIVRSGTPLATTEPSAWWENPVLRLPAGRCATDPPGVVHDILLIDATASLAQCSANVGKMAVVAVPGETVTDFDFRATAGAYFWVEGSYTMQTRFQAFSLRNHGFQVVRNATFTALVPGTSFAVAIDLGQSRASVVHDVTADGGRIVIGAGSATGVQVRDVSLANARVDAISFNACTDCSVERATLRGTTGKGLLAQRSPRFIVRDVVTEDTGGEGVSLSQVSNGRFENIRVTRAGLTGVLASQVDHSVFRSITVDSAEGGGVVTSQGTSTDNLLIDIFVGDAGGNGVELGGNRNLLRHARISCGKGPSISTPNGVHASANDGYNRVQDVTAVGCRYGISMNSSSMVVQGVTVAAMEEYGVNDSSGYSFLEDALAVDTNYGLYFLSNQFGPAKVRNFATSHNLGGSIYFNNSVVDFAEQLIVGVSGLTGTEQDCVVTSGTGLNAACGGNSANLTPGANVLASIVGKVTDTVNGQGATGTADYPAITSFTTFERETRRFIRNGTGAFPDYAARGPCTGTETCTVLDVALRASDTLVRNVNTLPTGNDVTTHSWGVVAAPADQAACDARFPGSAFVAGTPNRCNSVFLQHAWELLEDGDGDDDGLCESNETCEFAPNIGAYQGHGPLVSAGTFTDGQLTGITLMRRATNGY